MLKVLKYLYPFSFIGGDEDPTPAPETDPAPVPSPEQVLDIQKNYVKKEAYDKLQDDYRALVKGVLDGADITNPNGEPESPKISDLRKELYGPDNNLTNLEYVEKTLQLRQAIIEETGRDPFLPAGIKETPSEADAAAAARVADILQKCVDEANGDPEAFDVILSKKVI